MNWVGAKWWKFDLHNHTPASFDYGKGDASVKNITPRDWLLQFINHKISCVAVTDHNTGAWIEPLQAAAHQLRLEGHEIYVFPGVEITANSNIHILGIFDPSCSSAIVESIIGIAGFRGTRGDSDAVAEQSPEAIIDAIKKWGGVAIPAHIDMKAGLCQLPSHLTIKQTAEKASAVEVIYPTLENQTAPISRYATLKLGLAEILSSDSHHPSAVGRAFSWIKMGSPTIEGLRLALIDGNSSVRRSDSNTQDPNVTSNLLLHSVTVSNSKYAGRSGPLEIKFNPWLNSIIGGRGSGKSSILEFIRLCMDKSADLTILPHTNEIRQIFERFKQKSLGRNTEGVMLENTHITCVYSKQNQFFSMQWSAGNPSVVLHRWDDQSWIRDQGSVADRFPIKIFSQKQIFNLAQNPNSLIHLIDNTDFVNIAAWNMEWENKKNIFLRLSGQRREYDSQISNKAYLLGQLSDVQAKISAIENSGHQVVLTKYQQSIAKDNEIDQKVSTFQANKKTLELTLSSLVPPPPLSPLFFETISDNELVSKMSEIALKFTQMNQEISAHLVQIQNSIESFKQWYTNSDVKTEISKSSQSYQDLVNSLAATGVGNPNEYQLLIQQRNELNLKLANISQIEADLQVISGQVNSSYADLVDLRKQLSVRRRDFVSKFISKVDSINVSIEPLANERDFDSSFRRVLGRDDGSFAADLYDIERGTGILLNLLTALKNLKYDPANDLGLNDRLELINSFKIDVISRSGGQIFGQQIGKRFLDFLNGLSPQLFDLLMIWFPEDELAFQFYDGHRYKDISQGSAGQKAAAVLSFLLSNGSEPLILDQPEDDLDNGLVSSLIVKKLIESKAERQVIVVTHNPNIVVNADSDFVIALHSKGQIEVSAEGALQDVDVRRNVCEIMEGGELALQQRYRRMFNI